MQEFSYEELNGVIKYKEMLLETAKRIQKIYKSEDRFGALHGAIDGAFFDVMYGFEKWSNKQAHVFERGGYTNE